MATKLSQLTLAKLSQMTTAEVRAALNTDGNPEKIMNMFDRMFGVSSEVDSKNGAELENLLLVVRRLEAEIIGEINRHQKQKG